MKLNKVFLKRRLYYTCDIDLKKCHLQHPPSDRPHLQLSSTTAALAAALLRVVATLRQPRIDTGGLGGGVGVAGGRGGQVAGGRRVARGRGREDVLEEDVLEEDVLEKDVPEEDVLEEGVLEEDG